MRRALVLALALAPAACSIQSPYPGAWPGVLPRCADVSGRYLADGVRGDPFAAPTSFGRLVLDGTLPPRSVIELAQRGADSLVVVAWADGRRLSRTVFSRERGDLRCRADGLELACGWHGMSQAGFTLAAARRTVRLYRAEDGSLMALEVEHAAGLFVVFPMVGAVRSWHRFSPPTFPPLPEGTEYEP